MKKIFVVLILIALLIIVGANTGLLDILETREVLYEEDFVDGQGDFQLTSSVFYRSWWSGLLEIDEGSSYYFRSACIPVQVPESGKLECSIDFRVMGGSPNGIGEGRFFLLSFSKTPNTRNWIGTAVTFVRDSNNPYNSNSIMYFEGNDGTNTGYSFVFDMTDWQTLSTIIDLDTKTYNIYFMHSGGAKQIVATGVPYYSSEDIAGRTLYMQFAFDSVKLGYSWLDHGMGIDNFKITHIQPIIPDPEPEPEPDPTYTVTVNTVPYDCNVELMLSNFPLPWTTVDTKTSTAGKAIFTDLDAGKYNVKVTKEGYNNKEYTFDLNKNTTVDIELSAYIELVVNTDPHYALVEIEGYPSQNSSLNGARFLLPAGEYTITATKDGISATETIDLQETSHITIVIEQPEPSTPGFEIFTLIGAIFVALIILGRKRL